MTQKTPRKPYDATSIRKAKRKLDLEMKKIGFVTFAQAATRAKVHTHYMYNLRSQGRIPDEAMKRQGAFVYLSVDWIDATFKHAPAPR